MNQKWKNADGFFEEALNIDPKCAEAYIGKLLAQKQRANWSAWVDQLKEKYAEA